MTRLTLLAAAAVVGTGFAAQSASAGPPSVIVHPTVRPYSPPVVVAPRPTIYPAPRIDHDYVVLYRPSILSGWVSYGRFESLRSAQLAERRLGMRGVPSRIVRVRDYNGVFPW